jgi:hypothetical protein
MAYGTTNTKLSFFADMFLLFCGNISFPCKNQKLNKVTSNIHRKNPYTFTFLHLVERA